MIIAKRLCCMLTDDMYLYNGIKGFYPDMEILRESFSGDFLPLTLAENVTTIIIDARMLLSGKWKGYEKLIAQKNEANTIWMLHRSVCGFFKCENFLSCVCAYKNPRNLRAALLERIENKDGVVLPCGLLSSYEKTLLPYFVDGISFEALARFFQCSEKTLHSHRLHIASKFGFRSALHMSSILYRVPPSLIDKL